jgi:RNA 3'-terminal phosphate cyclase (ATP)
MNSAVTIDGSFGEGGGQILRSALALSLVTGRPVTIENIRAGREKPGLMRQHLTAVHAAAAIGDAEVRGAEIGSRTVTFAPRAVRPGQYHFSVGTAGSTTLVLQTVLPALLIANGPSEVVLEGGTHNQWAPPFHFLERAFLPLINRMGPRVKAALDRHGFYPVGGGRIRVSIEPVDVLQRVDLPNRGGIRSRSVCALVSNLPRLIAEREVQEILDRMTWPACDGHVEEISASGPGNVVSIELECDHVTECFTGFGRVGTKSEHVAAEVWRQARAYLTADVAVGPYLADQLLLPMGISAWQAVERGGIGGGSCTSLPLSRHSTSQIYVIQRLLGVPVTTEPELTGRTVTVKVGR